MDRVILKHGEVFCPDCDGYCETLESRGLPDPDQWLMRCLYCQGKGKLDFDKFRKCFIPNDNRGFASKFWDEVADQVWIEENIPF